jgi:hypothetical protein
MFGSSLVLFILTIWEPNHFASLISFHANRFCESHHVLIYGISCLTIVGALFVFPLTRRCRRQRRERRHQAEESVGRQGREHTNMLAASGEMSPLLCFGQDDDSYGSGKCRRDGD